MSLSLSRPYPILLLLPKPKLLGTTETTPGILYWNALQNHSAMDFPVKPFYNGLMRELGLTQMHLLSKNGIFEEYTGLWKSKFI